MQRHRTGPIAALVVWATALAFLAGCVQTTRRHGDLSDMVAESKSGDSSESRVDNSSKSDDSGSSKSDNSGSSKDSSGSSQDNSAGGDDSSINKTAQDSSEQTGLDSKDSSSNLASGSTVVVVLVAAVGLIYLTVALAAGGKDEEQREKARAFLEQNRRSIKTELARGAGPMVSDLAGILQVPPSEVVRVGVALQARRAALDAPLADATVTLEEADAFAIELLHALNDDPVLAPYVEELRTRAVAFLSR